MKGAWRFAAVAAFAVVGPIQSPAAAQQTVLAMIREAEAGLTDCYRAKSVALDDGRDMAAILKAAEAACTAEHGRFKSAWSKMPYYPAAYAESQVDDGVARAHKEAERAIERARADRRAQAH